MVFGAVLEKQLMADLEQQLHHAESAALAAETRVVQVDARQNEARAIDLNSSGKLARIGGQASGFRNFRFQFMAYCGAMGADMRREMEEAFRSEVPILTGAMRQGETAGSRQLCNMLLLVRWWSDGGHGERT